MKSYEVFLPGELWGPLHCTLVAQQAVDSPGSCPEKLLHVFGLPAGVFSEGLAACQTVYFGKFLLLLVDWLVGWLDG